MKLTEAIILAGGMGTRLQKVVNTVPKPMAPINDRPFLEYLLDHLISHGITRIIFSVGFKSDIIFHHFGNTYRKCELVYVYEDEPLGTGGAIRLAMKKATGAHVLVTNGDSLFVTDIQGQYVLHQNKNADVTLALKEMHDFDRYGVVVTDNDSRIHEFREKEAVSSGLINGGVYIFKVDTFTAVDFPLRFSVENHYFQAFTKVHRFFGYRSDAYFLDIGIPEDFARAQEEFLKLG